MLGILAVVVMASGCTTDTTTNKTFSSNGISFTYPGSWSELNNTDFANEYGTIAAAVGDEANNQTFILETVNIRKGQKMASTTEWAAAYRSGMEGAGFTFVSGKARTVDGQNGYEVVMQKEGIYTSNTYFQKGGTPYLAAFASTSNDAETVDMILNSLKVP